MANGDSFLLIAVISSYFWFASALASTFFLSGNNSAIWRNNNESLSQAVRFSDGSTARFILLEVAESRYGETGGYTFGCCFYCNSSAADSCHLSIVFLEIEDGTIVKKQPQVVWSANRDSPVGENAILRLSHDGDLVLSDENGAMVWSSMTSGKSVSGMCITQLGNMVIFDQSNGIVWQSYDHPTDTLLIGQTLRQGQQLTSSISSVSTSSGLFSLSIDHGTLSAFAGQDRPIRYLKLGPQSMSSLPLRYVNFFRGQVVFLFEGPDSVLEIPYHTPDFGTAQLLKLDSNGGVRIYGWEPGSGWFIIYVFLDEWDECQFSLKCGKYGVCRGGQCTCPAAVERVNYFTAIDSQFPNLGCRHITSSPSVDSSSDYKLVNFGNLSYFSYFDPDAAVPGLEDEQTCKQACASEASCEAAFFKFESNTSQGECYLLCEVLSITGTPRASISYYSSSHLKVQILPSSVCSRKLVILLFASGLILAVAVACLLLLQKKRETVKNFVDQECLERVSRILLRFTYRELCIATGKFSEKLGGGGFGMVFKGKLGDGTLVAVKRLENIGQGTKEFLAEVETVGNIHHNNLVRLIGFCVEKRHTMLVYEYMSNGSLDKWIFHENKNASIDWKMRKKIVLDIAKGLAYLHEECRQKIAHLDVKPDNILLDEDFNAKLSDFGMSKWIKRGESQVGIRGTLGCLAPEWQHSRITVKADIYSFGIVLLEVVSGRRNLDYTLPDSDVHLLRLLEKKVFEDRLVDIVDCQTENVQCHTAEAIELIRLGMWCLNIDYTKRPPMSLVVKVLEGVVELEPNISYNLPYNEISPVKPTALGSQLCESPVMPAAAKVYLALP